MPSLSLPKLTINFSSYQTVIDELEGLAYQARFLEPCPESIRFHQSFVSLIRRYRHSLAQLNDRTTVLFRSVPGISPSHLTPRGCALVDVKIVHELQSLTKNIRKEVVAVLHALENHDKVEPPQAEGALEIIDGVLARGNDLGERAREAALRAGAAEGEVLLTEQGDNEAFLGVIQSHTIPESITTLTYPSQTQGF